MMNWKNLAESSDFVLKRGVLLRFPAGRPFENYVVMMICEAPDKSGRLGLIAVSGYKAGINCYVVFPEKIASDRISNEWLVENWRLWVWPDGDINEVEVRDSLDALEIM